MCSKIRQGKLTERSGLFDIKRGVRLGCVLSPPLFCTILEMVMGMWRRTVGRLGDGGPTFLELRFADDILIFATTYIGAGVLLDELVVCLSQVGLVLNHEQRQNQVMTTDVQPPSFLSTPSSKIEMFDQNSCHKWPGCMLNMPQ